MGDESMPGIGHKSSQLGNAAAALCLPSAAAIGHTSSNGIWSKRRDDISFDQLQKFWNDLPPHSRRELLRIDKQTLFEQARKNLYCSRCNGLLLEGFSQLVMYGKSLQQDGGCINALNKKGSEKIHSCPEFDDLKDPSIHPWGGLMGTRDGVLTLMDSFIYGKSLRPLQNVFDSARARERERELLYPDACGGGGRGWISQGGALYGRGHGTRETCALHTARLSCETLVDFWSALADDTRLSLLRMKEEDFIERLMYRFDSKRFCRDCRRNVIREFKELKELKRMRREPRCTSWFCVADLAFLYEVSDSSIQVDWHQFFKETHGGYHHFEWAVGTTEGKFDILDFEDVGMNAKVQVDGLDLSGLNACFITLRAWKLDGRCSEVTVKAHGLKGHPCVHRRLMVGEGYVTITKGESIRSFFEHAEEVEEEEDDDSIDKDGSDLDSDGSRPQKHAKSPELAREFLLDAATVIFKEQVEKAFREGTARQNAHSTFVCLALKLLEERVHVACKEIVTLEKQIKLLEEEEREKREEEERRERRRAKEREKKLRRKERLKVKEMERETKNSGSKSTMMTESCMSIVEEAPVAVDSEDSVGDGGGGDMIPSSPRSPDESPSAFAGEDADSFTVEKSNSSSCSSASRKLRFRASPMETAHRRPHSALTGCDGGNPLTSSRYLSGKHRQFPVNGAKSNGRDGGSSKFSGRAVHDRCDFRTCACGHNASPVRSVREIKASSKTEALDSAAAPPNRIIRYGHGGFALESSAAGHLRRGKTQQVKQVWEPADPRKKFSREGLVNGHGSSEPADKPRFSAGEKKESPQEPAGGGGGDCCFSDVSMVSAEKLVNGKPRQTVDVFSMEEGNEEASSDPLTASSSSDNCSSCLSEGGDSSTTSSSAHNAESSYVSDSEDTASAAALQPLEVERAISPGGGAAIQAEDDSKGSGSPMDDGETGRAYGETPTRRAAPTLHGSHVQFPVFPLPTAGFPGQSPAVSWAPLVQLPQPHQFVFPHHHHHHLGYSVAGTPPPNFCTPLPPPPPRAAVLRPGHFPSFKAGAVPSEPPRSPNADHLRPPGGGEKESSAKSPSFSLFHFGGPAAAASVPPERPRDGDGPRTEAEVEYSLFSSRFSFLGSLNV